MKNRLCRFALGAVVGVLAIVYSSPAQSVPPTNIIAKYARNVQDYGAKGDGVTDDTQAFIQALQSARHQSGPTPSSQTIYVPAGNYLIKSTLIVWAYTTLVGDWRNPPTLILAPSTPGFQDKTNPQPFIVTAGGYNVPDNTTDWQTRTATVNGSTNQTFSIHIHDLNIKISGGNPAAWGIFWWCAQDTSLRNVNIDATLAAGCVNMGSYGGLSVIANCSFTGGMQGLYAASTSQEFIRNCIFTGQTQSSIATSSALNNFTFLDIDFSNTAPISINSDDAYNPLSLTMINCNFCQMFFGTFAHEPAAALMHFEGMTFDSDSPIPPFLQSSAQSGVVVQWSGSNTPTYFLPTEGQSNSSIYRNGQWISGSDSRLNLDGYPMPWRILTYPRPSAACVNIKDLGAAGDGSTDDTQVILNALATYQEIYFPTGTYLISAPLTINAGQKLYGEESSIFSMSATAPGFAQGSTASVVTVLGNGGKNGVVLCGISVVNQAPGGFALTWEGDPSSIMLDGVISNSSFTAFPTLDVVAGGGIFEGLWVTGNEYVVEGVVVQSQGPTEFYQISDEHFGSYSLVVQSAANLLLVNWEAEYGGNQGDSGVSAQIFGSDAVYVYGMLGTTPAGDWPNPLLELSNNKQLRIWDVQEFNLPNILQDCTNQPCLELGSLGSQVGAAGEMLNGYIMH
jgi:Pectate lyase superfamily protein